MGLFCINAEETIEGDIKAAIRNLELFLEDNCQSKYLLTDFALKQIDDAIKKLEEQENG